MGLRAIGELFHGLDTAFSAMKLSIFTSTRARRATRCLSVAVALKAKTTPKLSVQQHFSETRYFVQKINLTSQQGIVSGITIVKP